MQYIIYYTQNNITTMARKKKKMELLEEIVDEIIEAPVIEK